MLAPNAFKSGGFVNLGFDIDNSLLGFFGINSGLLFGAKISATIQSDSTTTVVNGVLSGPTGMGHAVNDGFGLIDAFAVFYKPEIKNGTKYYCRRETMLGSHFESKVCSTADQLRANQQDSKDVMDKFQREQPGPAAK